MSEEVSEFTALIGATVIGFHTHTCHNECGNEGEESVPMEDGVIVEKDGKRYTIWAVFCFDVPVEVEDSETCLQLSISELKPSDGTNGIKKENASK